MNGLAEFFRTLGAPRLAAMATVALITIGFFAFLTMRLSTPQMSLLFSGLDLADSSQIVQNLEGQNIPYELVGDGSTILVPKDRVSRLRMDIAAQGLNTGGSVGYEIFDNQDNLGTTSFVQNINSLRALEGELARTINSIDQVSSSRIHLVLPQRRLFSNESREGSASIFIKTRGGRLGRGQIIAIQNLVAAAVPELNQERISIVDQQGSLLARSSPEGEVGSLATSIEEKKISLENRLRTQIEELIAKTVGQGKVRAEVTAELDMNRTTSNSETYDPDGAVVLSTTTREKSSTDVQNAEEDQAISVANNLPNAGIAEDTGPDIQSQNNSSESEEVTNYSISKTISTQVNEAGSVRKLSVAVLVDGRYQGGETADDGTVTPITYQPRSDAEITQIEELVKSTIGFDETRGDTVSVINMEFAPIDYGEAEVEKSMFDLANIDIMRVAEIATLFIVSVLLILFGLRPLISYMMTSQSGDGMPRQAQLAGAVAPGAGYAPQQQITGYDQQQAALAPPAPPPLPVRREDRISAREVAQQQGMEAAIDVAAVEGRIQATTLKKVGELVERHPDESVAVVRSWLYG
ncbi:MAG: flagellar basal-body MS-ring/collar protein FliF [Emcibacteraceae bacterium]